MNSTGNGSWLQGGLRAWGKRLSNAVNACVNLRRDNSDHPFVLCFLPVTNLQSSLSRLFCHAADRCSHPTLRQIVSTWTLCGLRLAPRRANEGYTAEPSALARLVCTAYHRHQGRTACRTPNASTRSLRMPAEQGRSTPDHSRSLRPLRKPGCTRVR